MAVYLISPDAMEDLKDIRDFIALDNPTAADDVIDKLFDALEDLAQWPGQGHTRRDLTDRNVRFWPVGSYLVVYRSDPTPLQVVAILHGARDIATVMQERDSSS
jgi:plasmid stabilization system protein ParE